MIKRCTSCRHGVYDYGRDVLFCKKKDKFKKNNSACEDWEVYDFPNCSITHWWWDRCKHYYEPLNYKICEINGR